MAARAETEPLVPNLGQASALDAALRGRRSVRRYLPREVPDAELEAILEAARWAPSPHNSEPWRFVVLRSLGSKERLVGAMGARWEADLKADGVAPNAIAGELRKSRQRITGAPVVVLAC